MANANEKPLYADIAIGRISTAIGASATEIPLESGSGDRFPTPAAGEHVSAFIRNRGNDLFEEIEITGRVGDLLTVRRGVSGSALEWGAETELYATATAADLDLVRRTLRILPAEVAQVLVGGTAALEVDGATLRTTLAGPLRLPVFTKVERDALSAQIGDAIYNSTDGRFQGFTAEGWRDISGT